MNQPEVRSDRRVPLFRRWENWMLLAYFAVLTLQSVWAALPAAELSNRTDVVSRLVGSVVIAWWVMQDSARYGIRRPFILGFFLFAAWPLVAPFHLWRTRRWRAMITLLIFVGFWIIVALPYIVQDITEIGAGNLDDQ